MQYISGSFETFDERLHQLANTTGILAFFKTEGLSIQSDTSIHGVLKWNNEFFKKRKMLGLAGERPFLYSGQSADLSNALQYNGEYLLYNGQNLTFS